MTTPNPIRYPNALDVNDPVKNGPTEYYHQDLVYNNDNTDDVMANDVNVLIDICIVLERIIGALPYNDANYGNFTSIKLRLDAISNKLKGHVHDGGTGNPPKVNRDHIDIADAAKRIAADYLPMATGDNTKIKTAIDSKLATSEVVTTPTANKILKLNANGEFPHEVINPHQIPYFQMLIAH